MRASIVSLLVSPDFCYRIDLVGDKGSPRGDWMNRIPRRAVLRGAGVTMALPWLESFAASSGPPRQRSGCSRSASASCFWAMASTRITGVGRIGRRDEAQQVADAARAVEAQDQRDSRALQQDVDGAGHSSAADGQPSDRRHDAEGRGRPIGHLGGSDDCQARRARTRCSRAWCWRANSR